MIQIDSDQIHGHGMGVSLPTPIVRCDNCEKSRNMDDLHRTHIAYLGEELERSIGAKCELRRKLDQKISHNQTLFLVIFALVVTCAFLAASDLGVFKP